MMLQMAQLKIQSSSLSLEHYVLVGQYLYLVMVFNASTGNV